MVDWETNEFMSAWDKEYVSTNISPSARAYDQDLFLGINSDLVSAQTLLKDLAYTIIVSPYMCAFSEIGLIRCDRQQPVVRSTEPMLLGASSTV